MFTCIIAMMGQQQDGNMMTMLLPFLFVFAIFYFILIRPQQKKQKEFKAMIESLKEYDKVVTSGGIYGTITSVKDTSVILKIADNVKVEINKANIAHVLKEKAGETGQSK